MLDKGIGGSASGPQDGLINPSQFEIKSNALYPSQIEESATRLRVMGKSVRTQVVDIDSSWGRLKAHYEAPEEERVYNLMDPAVKSARELKSTLAKVAGHLDVYASTLHGLKPRLEKLEEDANDFRAEISGGVPEERDPFDNNGYIPPEAEKKPWDEVARTRNENAALVARYQKLKAEVSSAAAKCANSINELVEGGGIEDVEALSVEELANSPEKLPWGAPPKEDKNCLDSVGGGARDAGTVYGEMGVGLLTLVAGYNPDTGQVNDPKAKVGALRGLGDVGLSSVVAIGTLPPGFKPIRELPWVEDRVDVAASAWLEDLGYDHEAGKQGENPLQEWVDDPVATGTKSLLLLGPGLLGGGLGAGAKGVGAAGKGAKGLKASKGAGHMPSGMRPPKGAAATNPLHGNDASIDRLGGSYPSGHGPGKVTKEQLEAVDDVPPPGKSPDAPVSNSIDTSPRADSSPGGPRAQDGASGPAAGPDGSADGASPDSKGDGTGVDRHDADGRTGAAAESGGASPDRRVAWTDDFTEKASHKDSPDPQSAAQAKLNERANRFVDDNGLTEPMDVWDTGKIRAMDRGFVVEAANGGNLPGSTSPWDKLEKSPDGGQIATSIKSMDPRLPSYTRGNAVYNTLTDYVDAIDGAEYSAHGGVKIDPELLDSRRLEFYVPPEGLSTKQLSQVDRARQYAKFKGIEFVMREWP